MISIKLKDGSSMELAEGSSAKDLAQQLNLTAPHQALAAMINGQLCDLSQKLNDGDTIVLVNFEDPKGKELFWHSSAHILAQAVVRLWPNALPTIGPAIQDGFYYDFADLTISDADFPRIEEEMAKIIKENYEPQKLCFKNKKEILERFLDNPYKQEVINDLPENEEITGYQQGSFFDLCRGPHLPNLGKVKATKILKTSGAYWRGDASREMLTRIYAISFPDRKQLKEYLTLLEEAKKRDHKILGPKLDLFSLKEEAPGIPFIHPLGMIIWKQLMKHWEKLHQDNGYEEVKTPIMMSRDLWEQSGHWKNYRENMFTSEIEDREFAIKPMNCPGACLYFKTHVRSYRDLPLRLAEIGNVHRYEPSGALSGLFRVRGFHMDDAHIFMKHENIQDEILGVLKLVDALYSPFGLQYHLELSTRPETGTIGSDEDWELTTEGLKKALEATDRSYVVNEGDGAFYGPKIDIHIKDALGRTWQCGTIQLDMSLPQKFDLEYTASDGSRQRPIMIHRALYGSVERFFGILIEHYAGKFPLWLSPRPIRILSVADRHAAYAEQLKQRFLKQGFHCTVDDSNESVSKKVRGAQLDQVNYILTVGDKELENQTLSLRTRDNIVHGEIEVQAFLEKISKEFKEKRLQSVFTIKE